MTGVAADTRMLIVLWFAVRVVQPSFRPPPLRPPMSTTASQFTRQLQQFGTRVEKAIAHTKHTAGGSNNSNVNDADRETLAEKQQARVWTELVAQAERVKAEAQQLLDACFEGRASTARMQQPPPLTALVSAITAELANMQQQSDILSATIAAAAATPLPLPESARKAAAPASSTKKSAQPESSPARSSTGSLDENSSSNTTTRSLKKSASSATAIAAGKPAAVKKKLVLSSAAKAPRPSSAVTPGKKTRASVASAAAATYISPAKLAQTHRRLSIERQKQAAAAAEAKLIAESDLESMHEGDEAKTDSDAAHTDDDSMPVDGIAADSDSAAAPVTPAQPTRSTLLESPPTPDFANDALSEATRRLLESRSVGLVATSASSSSASVAAPRTPGANPNRMAPSLTVDSPATPELACVQLLATNQAVRAARKHGATPAAAAAAARKMSLLGAPRESLAPRTPGAVVATPARTLFPTATPLSSRARSGQLSRQSLGLPANSNAAAGLPGSPVASSIDALAPLRFGLLPGAAASSSSSAVFSAGLGDDSLLHDGLSTSMSMSNSLLATPVLKHQAGTTATLTQMLADTTHDAPSPAPLGELHSAKKKRSSSASMQQQRALAASASPPHRRRSPAAGPVAASSSSSSLAASLGASPPLSAALTSPAGSSIPTLVLPSAAAAATPRSHKKTSGLKTPKSSVRKTGSSKLTAAAGSSASKIPMLVMARSASTDAAAAAPAAPSTPAQEEKVAVNIATPSSPVLLSALSASFANSPAAVLAITSELTGPASAVKARRAATAK